MVDSLSTFPLFSMGRFVELRALSAASFRTALEGGDRCRLRVPPRVGPCNLAAWLAPDQPDRAADDEIQGSSSSWSRERFDLLRVPRALRRASRSRCMSGTPGRIQQIERAWRAVREALDAPLSALPPGVDDGPARRAALALATTARSPTKRAPHRGRARRPGARGETDADGTRARPPPTLRLGGAPGRSGRGAAWSSTQRLRGFQARSGWGRMRPSRGAGWARSAEGTRGARSSSRRSAGCENSRSGAPTGGRRCSRRARDARMHEGERQPKRGDRGGGPARAPSRSSRVGSMSRQLAWDGSRRIGAVQGGSSRVERSGRASSIHRCVRGEGRGPDEGTKGPP